MSAPTIYNYAAGSGLYLGEGVANPSPLEPGVWLYPANSTTLAPPTPGANQAAVFSGAGWSLVADYRGQTWYAADGSPVTIMSLGDPTAVGLSASPPAPPTPAAPTVADLAAALVVAAQAATDNLTTQVAPDGAHRNAYIVAAGLVGASGVAPAVDPAKTAFASLAAALGLDATTLVSRVVAFSAASFSLSAALTGLEQAAAAATTTAALTAAQANFAGALATIVATASSAGVTLTTPTITVAGLD